MEKDNKLKEETQMFIENEKILQQKKYLSFLQKKKEEYAGSFTVHGLSRIYTGTKIESLIWLSVVTSAVIFSSYFAHQLASRYLRYEIYTDVQQKVVKKNVFPAVTFCDNNRFMNYLDRYCGMSSEEIFYLPPDQICKKNYSKHIQSPKVNNDPIHWGDGYFHVVNCMGLGGKDCLNSKYLNSLELFDFACFRWNFDGQFSDIYGHVKLNFTINKTSGIPHVGFIRAYIHDARVTGMEITNTVLMEPSRTYVVGVDKTLHKRLPAPFPSKCVNTADNTVFHGKYSRSICAEMQDFIDIFKRCGDVYDNWRPYIPEQIKTLYQRNRTIQDMYKCMQSTTTNEAIEEAQITNCPFPCEEKEYLTIASSHGIDGKYDNHGHVIYRMELQLQSVNSYRILEEKPLFPLYQLLGEFGGLLGLITGASVISLIEIFSFLYLSIAQKCIMRNKRDSLKVF